MNRILETHKGSIVELILHLAWNIGLTPEEIHDLKWDQISLEVGEILLPDRIVPLDEETWQSLQARFALPFSRFYEEVILSDLRRVPMHRVYMSKIVREVLNQEGLNDITLTDLRNDFIIRQLLEQDWPYVARVSGLSVSALYANFSQFMPHRHGKKDPERSSVPEVNERKLLRIIETEDICPVGLTLWLSYQLGLNTREICDLTWEQVDLEGKHLRLPERKLPMDNKLEKMLREIREENASDADDHVLLTPQSHKPYDQARLSRRLREALIRGGMEDVTLQDTQRNEKRDREEDTILRKAQEQGSISRMDVMELLPISQSQAFNRLSRLVERKKLVKVGVQYYPAGAVVPPEEHYDVIRSHLETMGSAYRQELAQLLHLEPRRCGWILQGLVKEGKLVRHGQQYTLPDTNTRT